MNELTITRIADDDDWMREDPDGRDHFENADSVGPHAEARSTGATGGIAVRLGDPTAGGTTESAASQEGGTGCPASTGSPISSPTSPASPPMSPAPTPPPSAAQMTDEQIYELTEAQWKKALIRWCGGSEERANKILARRLCSVCDRKLRPFRDARSGAQGMRCSGCGREF